MNVNNTITPLYKKLGITNASEILILNQPKKYINFFSDFPSNIVIKENETNRQVKFVHIFVTTTIELEHFFKLAKTNLKKNGLLWISYPKKIF